MPRPRRNRGVDIDITPLIDVLFMLIIFFVLTTSFVRGAINLTLPGGSPAAISGDPIALSVTEDEKLFWAGGKIERKELPALVAEAIAKGRDITIAADRDAKYGFVAELMDELQGLGVQDVSLAFGGGE